MTFPDWATLRDHLIEQYGTTPHPSTEQEIIDAYQLHPDAVTKTALDLIGAIGISSHWGVLKSRAAKIGTPPANPARNPSIEREKTIARAEQWIRTTGAHYDRDTEILEELFGDRGPLRAYAQIDTIPTECEHGYTDDERTDCACLTCDSGAKWTLSEPTGDTALVERMTKNYHDARPAGITIEEDAAARAEKFKQHQADLAALKAQIAKARTPETRKPLPEADYSANPTEDTEVLA